ncbi:MAG TPA: ATP-binding protein [Acidimicrobiales bacterium]|nr:ATP-binding protein [Acidimicrobiales bacterium]
MNDQPRPAVPVVDPTAALEHLRGPGGYPPGFYGSIRRRLPVFALVGAASVLVSLLPFPHRHTGEVLAAGSLFFALTLTALLLPWRRLPGWAWPAVPIGYIAVIALLRDAQGVSAGLVPLYLLPIVWLAFYGKRWQLLVGLGALVLALVLPMVFVGGPVYPPGEWRETVVTTVVAALVSFSFLTMVARDRAYVADLAEQSLLAQESARLAVEAREQLNSLLQAATETAVIGTDASGRITFFSSGAEGLFGHRAEEVVGHRNLIDFLDPGDVATRAAQLGVAPGVEIFTAAPATGDDSVWTFRRKDGAQRRAAITVTTGPDADERLGYVAVASDVTEREELAAERERLLAVQREVTEVLVEQNRRLRELTQMKDDVVATVSHELRTPLTSIRGFVELLLDSGASFDDEQIRMLKTIDRNSLQLLRVAEDLLTDPTGGHGLRVHFVDTDLALLATEAIDTMAAQAATRRIELSLVARQPVIVNGDPARLHQLFGNLLSNAIKFTPPGGRVMVRVGTLGHFARLEVLDDGPGIPDSERPQLFERFYRLASTADAGVPGTGLGLAIAKSVVEAHEGTVDIVDTPGWSTTFRVLLPLQRAATAGGPDPQDAPDRADDVPGPGPSGPSGPSGHSGHSGHSGNGGTRSAPDAVGEDSGPRAAGAPGDRGAASRRGDGSVAGMRRIPPSGIPA